MIIGSLIYSGNNVLAILAASMCSDVQETAALSGPFKIAGKLENSREKRLAFILVFLQLQEAILNIIVNVSRSQSWNIQGAFGRIYAMLGILNVDTVLLFHRAVKLRGLYCYALRILAWETSCIWKTVFSFGSTPHTFTSVHTFVQYTKDLLDPSQCNNTTARNDSDRHPS